MKPTTTNIKAYCIEFERNGTDKVTAIISGETPGRRRLKLRVAFDFSCLPYILPRLGKQWAEAREFRVNEIDRIDKVLPTPRPARHVANAIY